MTVAIDNARQEPGRAPASANREDRPGNTDGTNATESSLAFGVLMDALRSTTLPKSAQNPDTSPNQMFERNGGDSRDARLGALKSSDQENRSLGSDPRGLDPTSIDARRADKAQQQRTENPTFKMVNAPSDGRASDTSMLSPDGDPARTSRRGDPFSRAGTLPSASIRDRLSYGRTEDRATPVRGAAQAEVMPGPPSAGKGAGLHAGPLVQGSGDIHTTQTGSASVAGRMGELLAAGRTGDVQAARIGGAVAPGLDMRGDAAQRVGGRPDAGEADRAGEGKAGSAARGTASGEFADLVKSIRMNAGLRRSSARLQLNPLTLGRVQVDVQMKDNVLQIRVRAESEEATTVLRERADLLRGALEHYGIQIDRFDISWGAGTNAQAGGEGALGQPNSDGPSSWTVGGEAVGRKSARDDVESQAADSSADAKWHGAGALRLDIRV